MDVPQYPGTQAKVLSQGPEPQTLINMRAGTATVIGTLLIAREPCTLQPSFSHRQQTTCDTLSVKAEQCGGPGSFLLRFLVTCSSVSRASPACNPVRIRKPLTFGACPDHIHLARHSSPVTISDLQFKGGNSPVIQLDLCSASFGWPLPLNSRKDNAVTPRQLSIAQLCPQLRWHCSCRVVAVATSVDPGDDGSAR